MQKLLNSKNKIKFKDRFYFIKIENLLDNNIYQDLRVNFPDERYFNQHDEFAKTLHDESENFNEFIKNNQSWDKFINTLKSKQFKNSLINFFDIKNIYVDNSWKKFLPFFKKAKMSFCFNISEKGGYSLPHTDSSRKLLSMVFFFVDDAWNEKNGGQVFLYKPIDPKYERNWRNKRIDKEYLEKIETVIPSPNKIYAFKKSKNSYHSVEPVTGYNQLKRKVLMINLIYENKNDSPYNEKISIIKKIKNKII